jgi:hypothetical protein
MKKSRLLSEAHEVWNRTAEPGECRAWAHWCEDKGDVFWKQRARDHKRRFQKIQELSGKRIEGGFAAEWGVGGGLNLQAFHGHFTAFYGIDISEPTLQECCRRAQEAHISNFIPVWVDISQPASALATVDSGSCVFVLSTACFQHFPSKEYAAEVVKVLYDMLQPGGLCMIQYRWDDGSRFYASKDKAYSAGKNCIRFTSHTIYDFVGICKKVGFKVLSAINMALANSNYTYLQKNQK